MKEVCFAPSTINCFLIKLVPFILLYGAACLFIYWRNKAKFHSLSGWRKLALIALAVGAFYLLCLVLVAIFFTEQCI